MLTKALSPFPYLHLCALCPTLQPFMERPLFTRFLCAPVPDGLAHSLQFLRSAQGPRWPMAVNEAWSLRLRDAGEVLPAAARKEAQGRSALALKGPFKSERGSHGNSADFHIRASEQRGSGTRPSPPSDFASALDVFQCPSHRAKGREAGPRKAAAARRNASLGEAHGLQDSQTLALTSGSG